MKKIMKKLALVSFVLVCILSITACGKKKAAADYNEETVVGVTRNVLALMQQSVNPDMADSIAAAGEEELAGFENEIASMGLGIKGKAFQSGYGSYLDAVRGDLGEIISAEDMPRITADEDTITSDITVTGTKTFPDGRPRTATVEIIMTKRGTVTSVVYNVDRTFNEKIVNAALNTVLGMGTTFCLLIFISIVIWLMGTIVQGMDKKAKEAKEAKAARGSAADNVVQQIAEREEQGAKAAGSDAALIAVISAAIAAYESEQTGRTVSPDTFIVRSLRRR